MRWAALCPTAWDIVFSGRVPVNYSTPPIATETRGVHNEIVRIVEEFFEKNTNTQYYSREDVIEYVIKVDEDEKCINIVAKPDLYVLWNAEGKLVNIVVEVTTQSLEHIPREWLAAEMLGFYIRNLRPTFTLLIQLDWMQINKTKRLEQSTKLRVQILPLSTLLFRELKKMICLKRARLREFMLQLRFESSLP
ncbi:MAG: hypothetical protein QXW41_07645 [Fervidicoccaceae archaeon]